MTASTESVNRELRMLDDAHRLGRIRRADYQARRRRLLATLCISDGATTARKPLLPRSSAASASSPSSAGSHPETRTGSSKTPLILAGAGILFLAALLVWRLHASASKTAAVSISAQPAVVASNSDQQADAMNALAQSFLRKDQWQADDIHAFLKTWNSVDAGARNRAAQLTAVQSLRDQTRSKRRAVALLLDDDNTNSQRKEQALALQKLDESLKGTQ